MGFNSKPLEVKSELILGRVSRGSKAGRFFSFKGVLLVVFFWFIG